MTQVTINKVVSKNFIKDLITQIQNMLGKNLTPYEEMINKGIKQIQDELKQKKIKLTWFRYEITQLTNGAVAIILYGETK